MVLERLDEAAIQKFTKRNFVRKKHRNLSGIRRKSFRRFLTLQNHGRYFCDKCGNSFKDRRGIYHHLKRQHQVKNFLFCDLCPKSFNIKSLIEHHMLQSHSKEKLACSICEYRSSTTAFLEEHMKRVHPNKKECQICHKFVKMMPQHLAAVHLDQSQRKVTCKVCGDMLKDKYFLRIHMTNMHGKNHKCDQCGEGFNFYELRV